MALRQSISTSHSTSQAGAASVLPSQVNTSSSNLRHATVNASIKIAGVLLFVIMCSLIVMSAQASDKTANNEFNNANKDSAASVSASSGNKPTAVVQSDTPSTAITTSPQQADSASSNVSLTVNGQTTDVPANSSVSKTVSNADGTMSVTLNSTSSGAATNTSYTSTSTSVMSNSSTFSNDNGSFSSGGSYSYSF